MSDQFGLSGISVRRSGPSEFQAEQALVNGLLPSGIEAVVECFGPERRYGGSVEQPARVNWPGIGSVAIEDAAAFGSLVCVAAGIAGTLRGPLSSSEALKAGELEAEAALSAERDEEQPR